MKKILLVEDQALVREALFRALIDSGQFEVTHSIADSSLAVRYIQDTLPDLVLMDISTLDHHSGIDATADIKRLYPDVKVMLMTGLPEVTFIERARKAGADSFVYKDVSMTQLFEAIDATINGQSVYPHESAQQSFPDYFNLTDREREILLLVCDGYTRLEIADHFGLTENTVKTHFSNLMSKTGFPSISKLAIYAVTSGFINPKIK